MYELEESKPDVKRRWVKRVHDYSGIPPKQYRQRFSFGGTYLNFLVRQQNERRAVEGAFLSVRVRSALQFGRAVHQCHQDVEMELEMETASRLVSQVQV